MSFQRLEDTGKCRDNVKQCRIIDHGLFKPYIGKKVTIQRESIDPFSGKKTTKSLKGRILSKEGSPVFLEKGKRTRGKDITAGLFDGFYATITVRAIKKGW